MIRMEMLFSDSLMTLSIEVTEMKKNTYNLKFRGESLNFLIFLCQNIK